MKNSSTEYKAIEDGFVFVDEKLKEIGLEKHIYNQVMLVSEELILRIEEEHPEKVQVSITNSFGEYNIRFTFPAEKPIELFEDTEEISNRILNHYAERIRTRYRPGSVSVTLCVQQSYTRYSRFSIAALVLALIVSWLLWHFVPSENIPYLQKTYLWPIERIFTRSVLLLATPVTFFCIVFNIANYTNLVDRYPDIRRVVVRYTLTSIVTIMAGYAVFSLIKPLFHNIGVLEEFQKISGAELDFSTLWDAIASMVPSNILQPFIDSTTLQLCFVAVLLGIAVGAIDRQTGKVKAVTDTIRDLFCKMLSIIFHFSPLMLFFCVVDIILYHGFKSIGYQLCLLLSIILGCLLICILYCVSLYCNGISPNDFFKKMKKTFGEVFLIGSSIDAVPITIKDCARNLNFPKRPLEVSIQLGAHVNMDGTCVSEMILFLVLAEVSGVHLSGVEVVVLGLLILAVTLGAPNQPGSLTVASFVILPQLGLSTDYVTTVLLVEIATSRILAMSNVIGDVVCATIVGERERRRVKRQRETRG